LVKVTTDVNDLDKDEVNIISGVLEMRKKTVGDIMTPIDDAYMLPITAILDFETISEIMNSGEIYFDTFVNNIQTYVILRILANSGV
jgi:metal transporter CNNM